MKWYKKLFLVLFLCLSVFTNSCKRGLYVPQEGDIIHLSVTPGAINPGETALITITGVKANGQPMPDDTLVRIMVDIGKLVNEKGETVEAVLLFNGKAEVTYQSNPDSSGVIATVTAQGGSAVIDPEQLTIIIKNIDIAMLFIAANPPMIPPGQDQTDITVTAYNSDMEPAAGKKLWFETTAGTLTPQPPLETNDRGEIEFALKTTIEATVTVTYKEVVKALTIAIGINKAPVADFEFSPQKPFSGDTVYFISTSTDEDGAIKKYQWNFGDGATSDLENPSHPYSKVEIETTFMVKLTVEDDQGASGSIIKPVTIGVMDNTAPTADFSYSPENPAVNEEVQFISESTDEDGTIDEYLWEFGDGKSSASQNPRYAYKSQGVYAVMLTVTDNDGKKGSKTKAVTVANPENKPPAAVFTFSPTNPISGDEVRFNPQGSHDEDGTITKYHWDFGDGSNPEEYTALTTVSHTYVVTEEKTYTVTLTVTDNNRAQGVASQEITVRPMTAKFSYSPESPVVGDIITFDASASEGNIASYYWDFGNGRRVTVDTAVIKHRYNNEGTYTVTLTVTGQNGESATTSQSITVAAPALAQALALRVSSCIFVAKK